MQASNFTYRANAKEMVMWDLNKKNAELMKALEEQTGVNLDHYHKLNIENNGLEKTRFISTLELFFNIVFKSHKVKFCNLSQLHVYHTTMR